MAWLSTMVVVLNLATMAAPLAIAWQPDQASPAEVVSAYLAGLAALDQAAMNRHLAEDAVSRSLAGDESVIERAAAGRMRDFERGVDTRWGYRVVGVVGQAVTVELTESNDFYDLLGAGTRTQRSVYTTRDGRIHRIETTARTHAHGDFTQVYDDFKRWLLGTEARTDPRLAANGGLVFDADSARLMRPWLERWASRRSGPAGPSIRDPRDGLDYPVVRIDSLDWLGRNLAFAAPASNCYQDESTDCATAGRLYDWTTALTACPTGWRLPTDTEWVALESALGMPPAALLAEGPRGSDQGAALRAGGRSRLNVPIAGYRRPSGEYVRRGERAAFWTASATNDDDAWHRDIRPDVGTIYRSPVTKTYKLSVRCVR